MLLFRLYQLLFGCSESPEEGLGGGVRGGLQRRACELREGLPALGGLKLQPSVCLFRL